jgi:hypothetical protein
VDYHRRGSTRQPKRPGHQVVIPSDNLETATYGHDLQAVAVGDVKAISQVDGHHLGIHQVEAVIAAADQPERERQLGRR